MAKVLLVEDDLPLSRLYARALEAEHEVLERESTAGAIEAIKAHRPDVMVLDLNLPDEPGTQVLQHLAAYPVPAMRVIVITGFNHHNTGQFGSLVYDVLEKPVMASALLRVINVSLRPS